MTIVINFNHQTSLNLNKLKLHQSLSTAHILIFNNQCLHQMLNQCWFILRKQVSQVILFKNYVKIWRSITWRSQSQLKILTSSVIQLMSLSCTISMFSDQLIKRENSESFTMFYSVMNLMLSLLQLLFCKLHELLFHKLCNFLNLSQFLLSCHSKNEVTNLKKSHDNFQKIELLISLFKNNLFSINICFLLELKFDQL